MPATIMLKDVVVTYDGGPDQVQAVAGVSLALQSGSLTAITGASGSGKSTLLNVMGGLEVATAGDATVAGLNMATLNEDDRADLRLQHVGMVFQDDNLIPVFSALENVTLPLHARGWKEAQASAEGQLWLERVGIGELAQRRPAEMSGGQRQRVGIARAVVGGREVLLADEPTGALDSRTTREIFDLLRSLADQGVCVVVVSHDPSVRDYADTVYEMSDGVLNSLDRATF